MAPWASRGTGRGPEETPPATLPRTHTSGDGPKSLPRNPGDDLRSGHTSVPCPSGSHQHRTQARATTQGPRGAEAQGTPRPLASPPAIPLRCGCQEAAVSEAQASGPGTSHLPLRGLARVWSLTLPLDVRRRALRGQRGAPARQHGAQGMGAQGSPRRLRTAEVLGSSRCPREASWPWVYAQVTLQARCALLVWGLAAFSHANDINSVVGFPGR